MKVSKTNRIDPKVKDILLLVGVGTFIAASLVFPGLPLVLKLGKQYKKDSLSPFRDWEKFNKFRLKQALKRLHQQKVIDIEEKDGQIFIKLTNKGEVRLLKYKLDEIKVGSKNWDGKWRLIIYDVESDKKRLRDIFRRFLKKMHFLQLQKSVYLTPHPCDDQIEFLRQYYHLGGEILLLEICSLENEAVYKQYFRL